MSFLKLLSLGVLFFSMTLFASSNSPFERHAPFKSAIITYSLDGSSKGTSTLYIKDHGKYLAEREKTVMTMFGFSKEEDTLTITTPDWVYMIDMLTKSGSKMTNMEKHLKQEYENLSSSDKKTVQKNAKKLGTDMTQTLGGDIKFNAAMLYGYSCDKATVMGITSYTIHNSGIVLKMEGSTLGMTLKKEATKIDKGNVPSSHFKVPEGVSVTHDSRADAMMKKQASSIIQMLLNPNQKQDQSMITPPPAKPSQPKEPYAPAGSNEEEHNKELQEAQEAVGELFKSLF